MSDFERLQARIFVAEEPSVRTLANRLNDGWDRIEKARAAGQNITAWENFWLELLREYETVSDALMREALEE